MSDVLDAIFWPGAWKMIYLVFLAYSDILLAMNHASIFIGS